MAENKEAKMDLRLRPYKGKRPQLGKRVYVDPCATLVGDIELAVNQHRKMTRDQRPKLTRVSWLISSSV